MDKEKGTVTKKIDSDFEQLKVWKDNKSLDYYLSERHWNFHVNHLLYKILQDFYRDIYDGPAEVGAYLDHGRDSFYEPTKDYSWQYGEMFNEVYRLCAFLLNTPVPETKVPQVANEASSLTFRNWELPEGCLPPVPNALDMILSYHILGMANAVLLWSNDKTDGIDRFLDALYRYNDTGVVCRKGALFEIRNHDFQFYHAVYLAQVVKQIIDASELRPGYDYSGRDRYLREKFIWYKENANNYEKMIRKSKLHEVHYTLSELQIIWAVKHLMNEKNDKDGYLMYEQEQFYAIMRVLEKCYGLPIKPKTAFGTMMTNLGLDNLRIPYKYESVRKIAPPRLATLDVELWHQYENEADEYTMKQVRIAVRLLSFVEEAKLLDKDKLLIEEG